MPFSPLSPCLLLLLWGPGGTLWSHLLSQAHPPQSGPRSGSSLERMKAPLNASVSFRAPALLPRGHTRLQDRIPLKPPWISQSLPPNRGAPHISPQREAGGEPPARTHTSYPSELPKAPSGPQHLQARQGPGQRLDMGPSWGLPWVQEGAAWVLGGYGHGRGQSHPSMDGGNLGLSGGAWNVQEEQVKQWAAETLVALEALHEQGVLCRDLNPRNLLLDQAGRCPRPGEKGVGHLHTVLPTGLKTTRVPQMKGLLLPMPPPGLCIQEFAESSWPRLSLGRKPLSPQESRATAPMNTWLCLGLRGHTLGKLCPTLPLAPILFVGGALELASPCQLLSDDSL